MELSFWQYAGMVAALSLVFGLGIYSAWRVHSSEDFSVCDRNSGRVMVAGTIMGTLIGGASTVGTAQLAFLHGISAWWFTLGGGLGCLFIALFLVRPMRESSLETVPQFLARSFGPASGAVAALFLSLGMFLNVVPQIFSSVALLDSWLPLDWRLAAIATVLLMVLYVVFGGLWGTGLMGISKVVLTGAGMLAAGSIALYFMDGVSGVVSSYPAFPWFSLFGRGINQDLAAAVSMLVGVFSSQIYFQAIFSGRDVKEARGGAFISAVMVPLIGLGAILVGLYMNLAHPDISPAQALPMFIMEYLPPWLGGVIFATLLLATVGTGAGLTLGISTMLSRDIFQRIFSRTKDTRMLFVFRFFIIAVLLVGLLVVYWSGGEALILDWSYLSLGMRGAAVCFPLLACIFLKDKIPPRAGFWSLLLGPAAVLVAMILPITVHPLYPGLAVSALVLLLGLLIKNSNR